MYCKVNKVNFYYEEYGEGTPVLFFSGFATDLTTMKTSFEPIFQDYQQWKRIYIDHPGVGKTKHEEDLGITEILNSVETLVNEVINEKTFLLVGASFGALVSQHLLNTFKERINGLFLIYPLITQKLNEADIEEDVVNKQNIVVSNDKVRGRIQTEVMGAMNKTNFTFLNSLMKKAQDLDLNIPTSNFNKPVCILTGRQDSDVGYRDAFTLLKIFPKATYCVLDNASHNLQIEQKQIFNMFVTDWLERVKKFNPTL